MGIGIIGLGAMGKNLVAAGHQARAWNRSGGVEDITLRDETRGARDAATVPTTSSDHAAIDQARAALQDQAVRAGWREHDGSAVARATLDHRRQSS